MATFPVFQASAEKRWTMALISSADIYPPYSFIFIYFIEIYDNTFVGQRQRLFGAENFTGIFVATLRLSHRPFPPAPPSSTARVTVSRRHSKQYANLC